MSKFWFRLVILRREYFNELDNNDLFQIGYHELSLNNELCSNYLIKHMKKYSDKHNKRGL